VLVSDCLKANQGKKWHKDVEATIIHHLNTYTNMTASKAEEQAEEPLPDGKQADMLLSGITAIDNPTARNWHPDVTSTNPMVTNHELINCAELGHQCCDSPPATTSSPAQSARRSASTPSATPSARQQGRSCPLSSSRRRAGTGLASSTMRPFSSSV
jgi:hypothetical protein